MEPQPYQIAEVTVNANAEDPAYEIMRKAIKMRNIIKNRFSPIPACIYKRSERMISYPKKFMGFDK